MLTFARSVFCWCVAAGALMAAACGDPATPTSPTTDSTTTTTPTAASPIYTEEFAGVVPVASSTFYSFSVTQYGVVNVTLTAVGGAFVPPTVTLGLAIGTPSGEGCAPTSSISTAAGSSAQLTGTYEPGVRCVMVSDVGNLFAPASFTVSIAYP